MTRSVRRHQSDSSTGHTTRRSMVFAFAASAVIHLFVWLAVVAATDHAPRHRIGAPVMSVRLVSLPGPPATDTGQPSQATAATPEVTPKPTTPRSVETVPLKTKKKLKVKKSLKKKTFKPETIVKKRIDKIEKQVAETRPAELEKTFQQLQQRVKAAEDSKQTGGTSRSDTDQTDLGKAGGLYGMTDIGDPAVRDRVRIYQAEIAYQIQRNWVFSEQLARSGSDLVAELGITVLPSGEIENVWFDRKSGNAHLDDSAYKAIMKSNPLPPLPSGLFDGAYTVGLRFGPRGLKQ